MLDASRGRGSRRCTPASRGTRSTIGVAARERAPARRSDPMPYGMQVTGLPVTGGHVQLDRASTAAARRRQCTRRTSRCPGRTARSSSAPPRAGLRTSLRCSSRSSGRARAPPLTAAARRPTFAQGRGAQLEITCASCPEQAPRSRSATTTTAVGRCRITARSSAARRPSLQRRREPAEGRRRSPRQRAATRPCAVVVHVAAYRVRPDLATLQGDRPAISDFVADASHGTSVALGENGGKPMQLVDGRGLEKVDVADALTGISDDVKTLSRQIPYVVTPADGPPETGIVSVSVGIVPLHIDAPGARVTTDQPSFVLAGHTMKGAEVIAAGPPIPVKADGTFRAGDERVVRGGNADRGEGQDARHGAAALADPRPSRRQPRRCGEGFPRRAAARLRTASTPPTRS